MVPITSVLSLTVVQRVPLPFLQLASGLLHEKKLLLPDQCVYLPG